MNVTYCWTEPSGYLRACISELATRPDVNVTLLTWESAGVAPFVLDRIVGAQTHVLTDVDRGSYDRVRDLVAASRPDVVVIAGWAHRPYVRLAYDPALAKARFVMMADTQLRFDLRQRLAPLKIGRFLRRLDAVVVPGERGFQLMRYWRVPASRISRLMYCVDYRAFSGKAASRFLPGSTWPRRFLYVGRYVEAKGINTLVDGYCAYRRRVADPWPLTTCGAGALKEKLADVEGIDDRGFLQPDRLADAFQEAGAFVLASRHEPWGQVIVEAAASGLPVICTQACGAGVEVVRDYHSGLVIPVDDSRALSDALIWVHHRYDRMPAMGQESQHLASGYSAERWADSQVALARRLTSRTEDI